MLRASSRLRVLKAGGRAREGLFSPLVAAIERRWPYGGRPDFHIPSAQQCALRMGPGGPLDSDRESCSPAAVRPSEVPPPASPATTAHELLHAAQPPSPLALAQCPVVSFGKDARGEAVYTPGVICTTTWRVCCLCPQCGGQQYQQRDEGAVAAAAATSVSSGDGGGSSGHCGTPPAGLPIITGSYNLEEAVAAAAAAGSREVGRNPPGAWFTGPEWQRHCGAASTKAWQRSTKLVAAVGGAQQLLQVPAAAGTSAAAAPAAASSGSKLVSMEHEIESRLRLKLVRRVNAAGSEYRTRNPAGEVEYQLMPLQEYRKGRKKTGVQAGQFGVAAGAGEQTAEEPPQPLLVTQARARTSAGSRRPRSLPSNSAAAGGNKGASCSSSGGKAAETAAAIASAAVAGAAVPQCAMMPGARTFLVDHLWREYFQRCGALRQPADESNSE